jgi:hypothetical protein
MWILYGCYSPVAADKIYIVCGYTDMRRSKQKILTGWMKRNRMKSVIENKRNQKLSV